MLPEPEERRVDEEAEDAVDGRLEGTAAEVGRCCGRELVLARWGAAADKPRVAEAERMLAGGAAGGGGA